MTRPDHPTGTDRLAEVQVDETDVVRLALADSVRITIDAYPDTSFVGYVTKISNSVV